MIEMDSAPRLHIAADLCFTTNYRKQELFLNCNRTCTSRQPSTPSTSSSTPCNTTTSSPLLFFVTTIVRSTVFSVVTSSCCSFTSANTSTTSSTTTFATTSSDFLLKLQMRAYRLKRNQQRAGINVEYLCERSVKPRQSFKNKKKMFKDKYGNTFECDSSLHFQK